MSAGDYVPCPFCKNFMSFGNVVCGECATKYNFPPSVPYLAQPPKSDWVDAYDKMIESGLRDDNKTLNELVDDVLGENRPTKPIKPYTPEKSLDEEFEAFFNEEPCPKEKVSIKKLSEMELTKAFDEAFRKGFDNAFNSTVGATKSQPRKTLVVNIFSGPGAGKSTMCAGLFADLKHQGVECEMALEYAKDLVWQKRNFTFEDQLYLFAKQHHRIFCLLGQVDVVITDCPILLSPVYDGHNRKTFEKLVVEEHKKMWTYNVFLARKKTYNPHGRIHTKDQAYKIDRKTLDVLDRNGIPYEIAEASEEGQCKLLRKINMLRVYDGFSGD